MSLRKQCNEDTAIDRFANDYMAFLQEETGYTGWTPQAKVLECDEREWADLFRLYARISGDQKPEVTTGKLRSHWPGTTDAYSMPVVVRYPTGELRRSTEAERLRKQVSPDKTHLCVHLISRRLHREHRCITCLPSPIIAGGSLKTIITGSHYPLS